MSYHELIPGLFIVEHLTFSIEDRIKINRTDDANNGGKIQIPHLGIIKWSNKLRFVRSHLVMHSLRLY